MRKVNLVSELKGPIHGTTLAEYAQLRYDEITRWELNINMNIVRLIKKKKKSKQTTIELSTGWRRLDNPMLWRTPLAKSCVDFVKPLNLSTTKPRGSIFSETIWWELRLQWKRLQWRKEWFGMGIGKSWRVKTQNWGVWLQNREIRVKRHETFFFFFFLFLKSQFIRFYPKNLFSWTITYFFQYIII